LTQTSELIATCYSTQDAELEIMTWRRVGVNNTSQNYIKKGDEDQGMQNKICV